jgi:hypothetical protein
MAELLTDDSLINFNCMVQIKKKKKKKKKVCSGSCSGAPATAAPAWTSIDRRIGAETRAQSISLSATFYLMQSIVIYCAGEKEEVTDNFSKLNDDQKQ